MSFSDFSLISHNIFDNWIPFMGTFSDESSKSLINTVSNKLVQTNKNKTKKPLKKPLTFPYLLNRFFRSVALVVEANPLTQKFLPELLALRPSWENKQTKTKTYPKS